MSNDDKLRLALESLHFIANDTSTGPISHGIKYRSVARDTLEKIAARDREGQA